MRFFYCFSSAKSALLNNLLHILGKDKVEQWMKNKWLEFKPNPQIDFVSTTTSNTMHEMNNA